MQNLMTLAVLGLAAARGTQLVVHDSIADPVRDRIEMWHAAKFESRFRTFVRDLLSCVLCAGFWVSVITLAVYLTAASQWGSAPLWIHAVEAWAVAAVQMTVNLHWDR